MCYSNKEIFIELRNKDVYIAKQTHLRNKGVTRSGLYEYISGELGSQQEGKATLATSHHFFVDAKYFVSDLKFCKDLRYPAEWISCKPFYGKDTTTWNLSLFFSSSLPQV